ncbi:MAG: hypothetical protein KC418_12890 [Anaerolineales bacterium]|nr:hypothetical protein [Anaerolineales bacterium]
MRIYPCDSVNLQTKTLQQNNEVQPGDRTVTSIGFWLPVGRSNFFHAEFDQRLLEKSIKTSENVVPDFRIRSVLNSQTDPNSGQQTQDSTVLNSQEDKINTYTAVYRRFQKVLYEEYGEELSNMPVYRRLPTGLAKEHHKDILDGSVYCRLRRVLHEEYDKGKLNIYRRLLRILHEEYGEDILNTSVYRRLLRVLHGKCGYELAIPYFPDFRLDYLSIVEDTDPDSVVLISGDYPLRRCQSKESDAHDESREKELFQQARESTSRIILVVSDDGFYQWYFHHMKQGRSYSKFVGVLKQHILEVMGNLVLYKSNPEKHETGPSNFNGVDQSGFSEGCDRHFVPGSDALSLYAGERKSNNERQERLGKPGALVFFQLNLILEGLFNSLFDPTIFFASGPNTRNETDQSEKARRNNNRINEEQQYSLRNFIETIVTYTDIARDPQTHNALVNLFDIASQLTASDAGDAGDEKKRSQAKTHLREELKKLTRDYHNDSMRRDFLRQFMRKTSSVVLKTLKWNLEGCRRELLHYTISFTDYQQLLLQIPSRGERPRMFFDTNESQLAGYVKLVSAKLPLLDNTGRYLKIVYHDLNENCRKDIRCYYDDWISRLEAIVDNVRSLERTLDRVNDERQLHEQSQIRREQETQAEIARRRQRLGISAEGGGQSVSMPGFLDISLIFIGAISALFTITYGISQPFIIKPWALRIIIPFFALYFLLIVARIAGNRIAQANEIRKNRFYHELDLTLELPIDSDGVATLFEKGLDKSIFDMGPDQISIPSKMIGGIEDRLLSQQDLVGDNALKTEIDRYFENSLPMFPRFRKPEKVAYRYSHGNFNEGTHKVHYEFDIHWPQSQAIRKKQAWYEIALFPNKRVVMKNCEIIFEVLSHSPSSRVNHMLSEVRFFATYEHALTPEQIMYLKIKLVNNFILRWLPAEHRPLEAEIRDNILPLFTLTIAALESKKAEHDNSNHMVNGMA